MSHAAALAALAAATLIATDRRRSGSQSRSCAIYPISEDSLDADIAIDYPDDADPYDLMDRAESLFNLSEIRLSRYEVVWLACIEADGSVVGALSRGLKESVEYRRVDFSVVVDASSRRRGIARALVTALIESERDLSYDLSTQLHAWVVNPKMARLLKSMDFDHEGSGEWSEDEPYMEKWL